MKGTADFLGLRRNTALLLVALVLIGTGERLWINFAPKYLQVLGAGIFVIGVFDALQTFLCAVYAYPGGWLTDHWGQRRSLLLFTALSIAGYAIVLIGSIGWPCSSARFCSSRGARFRCRRHSQSSLRPWKRAGTQWASEYNQWCAACP